MIDRAAYEQELKSRNADEDEEDTLEVFADNDAMEVDEEGDDSGVVAAANENGKGKGKDSSTPNAEYSTTNKYKRRRAPIDPFAGE